MESLEHLVREIHGVHFPYPVMVAGGVVKTAAQVRRFASTDVIPEWGSIEKEPSSGNGGDDYHAEYLELGNGKRHLLHTQNSLGLPNPGMEHVEETAEDLIKLYADYDKPLAINVSGKSIEETVELVERAVLCGFRVITANGSCPNKAAGVARTAPMLCLDHDSVDETIERVDEALGALPGIILLWKVSTGMPRLTLDHNWKGVLRSKAFKGIITGNTVANSMNYLPSGHTTIRTANGISRGGMGGPAILPHALDHTEYCASKAENGKIVVGCGGIMDANGARKFFKAGASLVQLNSGFRESGEDPDFIQNILTALAK